MTGFTDYVSKAILNLVTGRAAMFSTPTAYVALFTAMGNDAGTGFTEVSGGGYARVATASGTWNASSGSAPSTISNASAITFPEASADWGTIVGFGLYDASTGGNLLDFDWLGNYAWLPFTATLASPSVLDVPGNGYANGDKVVVTAEYGGTLPTGFTAQTVETVAGVSGDTFNMGVNASSTGNGMVRKVASQAVASGVTASFSGGTPGALVLTSA